MGPCLPCMRLSKEPLSRPATLPAWWGERTVAEASRLCAWGLRPPLGGAMEWPGIGAQRHPPTAVSRAQAGGFV
jgi:hypothetical protein